MAQDGTSMAQECAKMAQEEAPEGHEECQKRFNKLYTRKKNVWPTLGYLAPSMAQDGFLLIRRALRLLGPKGLGGLRET